MSYYSSETILPRLPRHRGRKLSVVPIVALLLVLVVAAPALAAKGGTKGKPTGEVTLTVSATEAEAGFVLGEPLVVSGAGYGRDAAVFVVFGNGLPSQLVQADRSGTFSFTWTAPAAGSYTLSSYEKTKNKGWEYCTQTTVNVG